MATKPFTVTLQGKETQVYQSAHTGLFYSVRKDGTHTPVAYCRIRAQATSIQRLKYWRNRYGYTQADLARLIHVSSPTVIMMWENGLRYPREEYRRLLNAKLGGDVFPG